jgi:phosphatidylglycerol:prolipoprotein diacylglycerol transferase
MTPLVLPYPVIDPVLISFGPLVIRWYALAYIAGLLIGWWYSLRLIGNTRLWTGEPPYNRRHIDDVIVWIAIGVVFGGRLGYVLFYNLDYFLANPLSIFMMWQGGMSFHGGLIGAALGAVLFTRKHNAPTLPLLDIAAAAAPIGLFFGRIANFIKPELWGRVTDVPWAMVFPGGGPLPRHPSQLYEAALEGLLLFAILRLATHLFGTLKTPGRTAGLFAFLYATARIAVEFFRQPDPQLGLLAGPLTMGMLLSIPLLLAGIWLLAVSGRPARS